MYRNTDFNTKKYIILMFIICLTFFIIVIKAFDYIPVADKEAIAERQKMGNINTQNIEVSRNFEPEEYVQSNKKKKKHVHIDLMKTYKEDSIEEIKAPKGVDFEEKEEPKEILEAQAETKVELSPEEQAVQKLYNGKKLYLKGSYSEALSEFSSVAQQTSDSNLIASAYEGISHIYAANKKYGTALSFATKAYSLSPSSSREMLMARLYYKTGDVEKATKLVNNILHRDFINN